ncbi:MAG TPA: LysR family transcriptional regulator [Solirubrobacteraceae bacterium]|nr:LysR family transcriptional regulator [Solirubrobacteraceae bacterium]
MTLQQLLYFRIAAELGSFNAAARTLHCTQPAVSDQVRRLEQELGVSLFARTGRGLTLTAAGRTFLGHARRVTDAADDAQASVGRRSEQGRRLVTLGTFRNAPYYDIADLAARFVEQHPDGILRMRGQNSYDVARAVQEGELEAGLVVLPVDDSLLDVRALFRDEVLFVSADHELTRHPATIAKVAATPLILYDVSYGFNDPTRRQLAARAQEAGITIDPRMEVEHVETALQLCARGLGNTMVARAVLGGSPMLEALTAVSFAEQFFDFFALVTRRGVQLSRGVNEIVELIDEWSRVVASRLQWGAPAGAPATDP